MKNKLEWNVYRYEINHKEIEAFNIFDHGRFKSDFMKLYNKSKDRGYFAQRLKSDLMYYFWTKCEYEILISPWIGDDNVHKKIDIYSQIMLNWEHFLEYCWNWHCGGEK